MKREESIKQGEVRRMEGDAPHRVFVRGRPFPSLSMSRSIGDTIAVSVGVISELGVKTYSITQGYDLFVIICSDGVWEFIKNKDAITLVKGHGKSKLHEATENLA